MNFYIIQFEFKVLTCRKQLLFWFPGGHDGKNPSSDVWEYDESSETWKASTSLSRGRELSFAHVIPYDSIVWSTYFVFLTNELNIK